MGAKSQRGHGRRGQRSDQGSGQGTGRRGSQGRGQGSGQGPARESRHGEATRSEALPSAPATPPARDVDLLYGIHPVLEALRAGRRACRRLLLKADAHSQRLDELRDLAHARGLPVVAAHAGDLERLCGNAAHQGAVLEAGRLAPPDAREALALPLADTPLLVALDEVEDPQNLGAIVRSCAVFGAAGVVLPRHHSAALNAAASKASAGTLESYPLYEAANLARFLGQAREAGWWVAGTVAAGGQPLREFQRAGALVLVLGNEGRGLRPLVARNCDLLLTIPVSGGGSLNVSNAAAVLLYQLSVGRAVSGTVR
ncbi:MAG: 23S rRNA (guanosine(2251)-2'-O)-methyltransferase RlmB [Candidatus Lambdaproteobacteria bacterium]|nr:23S rRNA (guanosine(2251)-2'-O)-methyltransferase RlmB [Candidatus Lambdaproteobacteria bacterium]